MIGKRILGGQCAVRAGEEDSNRLESYIFLNVIAVRPGGQVSDSILPTLEADIPKISRDGTFEVVESETICVELHKRRTQIAPFHAEAFAVVTIPTGV